MLQDSYIQDFLTFLRFSSVSTDPEYHPQVAACADWLIQKLKEIGLKTELHPTQGHPIVVARNKHKPSRKTVLIYGHYDVQPVDPIELWHHDPFKPSIENGIVTARGASDNKGQILSHILGVQEALKQNRGELPVNLIFLIEGEEECGSTHLADFLEKYRKELACDVVVISDTGMIAEDTPTLTYGLRGIAAMELSVYGPAKDLHSGVYGGAVVNPATALAQLLASMHRADGSIAIDGFYNDVRPIADWERSMWRTLDPKENLLLETSGAPQLGGENGYTPVERAWARPTAEINGMWGGYQGKGTKTVLPKEAHAKLTFRLVPDQKPEDILRKAAEHFKKHVSPSVHLEMVEGHGGLPYLMNPKSKLGKIAEEALQTAFNKPVAMIREGGSIPIVCDFKRILNADTLLLGLALPDCNAHSPNETFHLKNLEAGIRLNQIVLEKLSKM